jgi:hypothetical protein
MSLPTTAMVTSVEPWRPVMGALVETLLAFEHPDFPRIELAYVEERLFKHFPIDRSEHFEPLRQALMGFDAIRLFPEVDGWITRSEAALLETDGFRREEIERAIAEKARADREGFEALLHEHGAEPAHFHAASLPWRRAYLRLWARSGFAARRRFYRTVKPMVLVAAYSLPELWQAIGYSGPLIGR